LEGRVLNLNPRYLLVPVGKETLAMQFITSPIVAAKASDTNPFYGQFSVISDPRLDANSSTAWYLAADPAAIDTIELAYLEGQDGVFTERKLDFDTDGFAVKARVDRGAKVIDHRGLVKNAGA